MKRYDIAQNYLGGMMVESEEGDYVLHDEVDATLTNAYAEGRKDEREEDGELLRWAYGKLHHINFTKQDDALMLDRFKLLLEHGVRA